MVLKKRILIEGEDSVELIEKLSDLILGIGGILKFETGLNVSVPHQVEHSAQDFKKIAVLLLIPALVRHRSIAKCLDGCLVIALRILVSPELGAHQQERAEARLTGTRKPRRPPSSPSYD